MDRTLPACAPGVNPALQTQPSQYSTITQPWHNPRNKAQTRPIDQQSQRAGHDDPGDYYGNFPRTAVDIYALVDSWRSYKDDTTNLQSTATSSSNLNAAAPSFQPAQNGSYYKPYEPLRISDGAKERQLVEQIKTVEAKTKAGFAERYPVRANRHQADQPLPSIENVNLDYFIRSNSLNQAIEGFNGGKYRKVVARNKTPRRTASPAAPSSTEQYLSQAQKEPQRVAEARKLLVILDLNGTLLYRVKAGTTKIYMRPGVVPFLRYLFTNHVIMVYTSTMPDTARDMVNQFMPLAQRRKLAAIWARDKLDLNEQQYRSKVQVYKKLDKIWKDAEIQATAESGRPWDQSNTILVDDSKLKALAQPHNLLQVSEYTKEDDPSRGLDKASQRRRHKTQLDILKQLELKLEELKFQENVSQLIRKWQSGEVAVPKLPGQVVSVEEDVDQKNVRQQKLADKSEQAQAERAQLLTPVSLTDGDTAERLMEISDDEDSDGGLVFSSASSPVQQTKPSVPQQIPGLAMVYEDTGRDKQEERRSSESSIDEAVFQNLLDGNTK